MEEVKYIPGDLVMTNGVPLGTARYVVYRVTSSDPSNTLKLNDGTVMKGVVRLENLEGVEFGDKGYLFGDSCAWVKDIVPIPLTPEILEKNGWYGATHSKQSDDNTKILYKTFKRKGYPTIKVSQDLKITCELSPFIVKLESVPDLQHLLFGLRLNSEMEV